MNSILQTERVTIVNFEQITVATLEHRGDPRLIGDSIRKFIAWRQQNKLPPCSHATFNLCYDNPADVAPGDFRMDLCVATDMTIPTNPYGIGQKIIPGGRCAVVRHIGTEANLEQAALYLYSQWLPHSGETVRDFPLYLQRHCFFPDVPEHEAITDVFLPLE